MEFFGNIKVKKDPIEETELYKSVVKEVDQKAKECVEKIKNELIADMSSEEEFIRDISFSHRFAYEKKRILKEEYGIEWKTVYELNTDINFD